jgi:pimeloyl-ACP methyl ester carboxylesterase
MTQTDEFPSLIASAGDLGIPVPEGVRYRANNIVLNGLRFHYLEWGDPTKQPLVLLHGSNQTAHSWDLVSLTLSDRFHIIALDQRGHGDSEWPRDGVTNRHTMAADAYELIRLLGLEQPIVCGHSMGGVVTITLLSDHPELARKGIVVDIGPIVSAAGAKTIGEFTRAVHEVASLETFIDRVAAYDKFRSREHISRTVRYNLMQRVDGRLVSKHDYRGRDLVGLDGQPMRRVDPPTAEDVAKITCPILIIHGEQSNVLTEEMGQQFVEMLPDGRMITVPACGHNVHSQNTKGFLAAVEPFLMA